MEVSAIWPSLSRKKNTHFLGRIWVFCGEVCISPPAVKPQVAVISRIVFPLNVVVALVVPKTERDIGSGWALGLIVCELPGDKIVVPGNAVLVLGRKASLLRFLIGSVERGHHGVFGGNLAAESFVVAPKYGITRIVGCIQIVSSRNPPAHGLQALKGSHVSCGIARAGIIVGSPHMHEEGPVSIFGGIVKEVNSGGAYRGNLNILCRRTAVEYREKSGYAAFGNCLIDNICPRKARWGPGFGMVFNHDSCGAPAFPNVPFRLGVLLSVYGALFSLG